MIHLVLGRQGSGKTLFMVAVAYREYLKGRKIYSNVALNFPFTPLKYADIVKARLKDAVVILDEIHILLPSRNSLSKRSRIICDGFLSMVRKQGLDVYGSTQTIRKVDVRFREEADYIYDCDKFAYQGRTWVEITHNQNLPPSTPILIKVAATETFSGQHIDFTFLGNGYFKMFDTNQIIVVKEDKEEAAA